MKRWIAILAVGLVLVGQANPCAAVPPLLAALGRFALSYTAGKFLDVILAKILPDWLSGGLDQQVAACKEEARRVGVAVKELESRLSNISGRLDENERRITSLETSVYTAELERQALYAEALERSRLFAVRLEAYRQLVESVAALPEIRRDQDRARATRLYEQLREYAANPGWVNPEQAFVQGVVAKLEALDKGLAAHSAILDEHSRDLADHETRLSRQESRQAAVEEELERSRKQLKSLARAIERILHEALCDAPRGAQIILVSQERIDGVSDAVTESLMLALQPSAERLGGAVARFAGQQLGRDTRFVVKHSSGCQTIAGGVAWGCWADVQTMTPDFKPLGKCRVEGYGGSEEQALGDLGRQIGAFRHLDRMLEGRDCPVGGKS